MLVRLVEYNWTDDDDSEMVNPIFISGYVYKDASMIIKFVKSMIGKDVRVGEDLYTVEDFVWVFPKDDDSIPCLDVYCCGY